MEINEAGQDELPGRVNAQSADRNGHLGGRSDRGDPLALDDDGGMGRGAAPVPSMTVPPVMATLVAVWSARTALKTNMVEAPGWTGWWMLAAGC